VTSPVFRPQFIHVNVNSRTFLRSHLYLHLYFHRLHSPYTAPLQSLHTTGLRRSEEIFLIPNKRLLQDGMGPHQYSLQNQFQVHPGDLLTTVSSPLVTRPDPIPPPLPPPPLSNSEHPLATPHLPRQRNTTPPHPNLLDEDTSVYDSPPPIVQAAPPRPPNPELMQLHARVHEKLRAELASVSQAMTHDRERLQAQQTDLLSGIPAIRDEMGRLEAVRDVCRGVTARLLEAIQAAERGVAELKRKGDPPVDELVCSTSIVHNQYVL
jgi:hypothetical protein